MADSYHYVSIPVHKAYKSLQTPEAALQTAEQEPCKHIVSS